MTDTPWTKGPWDWEDEGKLGHIRKVGLNNFDNRHVIEAAWDETIWIREPDADLIALAPEMAGEILSLVDDIKHSGSVASCSLDGVFELAMKLRAIGDSNE